MLSCVCSLTRPDICVDSSPALIACLISSLIPFVVLAFVKVVAGSTGGFDEVCDLGVRLLFDAFSGGGSCTPVGPTELCSVADRWFEFCGDCESCQQQHHTALSASTITQHHQLALSHSTIKQPHHTALSDIQQIYSRYT